LIQDLRIDTANIRHFRALLGGDEKLLASIGQFAQFRVIIDANFVVRALLQKIKYPERGPTALENWSTRVSSMSMPLGGWKQI
jgi:hypothetical protein